jgi:hypothetical protein
MLELHPEILKKNGKNEFVVLPWEEYVLLREQLEDAEDVLELRRAKVEEAALPGVSLEEVKKRFGSET